MKVLGIKRNSLFQAPTELGADINTKGTATGRREIAAIGRAKKAQVTERNNYSERAPFFEVPFSFCHSAQGIQCCETYFLQGGSDCRASKRGERASVALHPA